MNTLELTLQRKTESGYPVIAALTRPGGFLPLRREGTLTLDPAALAELQYDPLAYGAVLGQALFVDEIRDIFREGLASGKAMRVLLSIEAPDLRALDWHRLAAPFDGRWRFLAAQQNTPFSLAVPSPASAHFPVIGRRDLRALLLVAGPESLFGDYQLDPFDIPTTTESVRTALGEIPCDILDDPSLDTLCAALTVTPYTILHIVCHGAVTRNGETVLYFPKDERGAPTPASDLLDRLASLSRLPHFVFLSACESALPQNGLGSLAQRLVRELGLPAVLAMTDRVSIANAGAFAAPFYPHLYQHGQPDLALAQSLAGLQGAYDLTVPAIFSRLGDRPLFDDNTDRELTEKEIEFGLDKMAKLLPERAPVMDDLRDSLTRRLRSTLGTEVHSLSESSRTERKDALEKLNSLSLEALDLLSFNALCLGQNPPAYDSRSPFRGLESFRPEDTAYFFGRETLTKKLVQKLNEHNFLAVLGASGSGKSSLVMAGLVPSLNVPYAIFRPGAEPLSELEKALQVGPKLLVVDQFEELFTLSVRERCPDFIARLLEQSQRVRVIITLRADFLGEVAPFKLLKDEVQNHQEIIPPMDEAELCRAMEGQATCAGLRFESDLSQQMLDNVSGEPGAMPLLQFALLELWNRRHGRWLRAEEYRAFGGVKQAIASTAEDVFARCSEFERERLRDIFLRLTRLDESTGGRDTRRRVLLRDLIPADSDPDVTKLLVKRLADARLVVIETDVLNNKPTEVEVAHEELIRHWERLKEWLTNDRQNNLLYQEVRLTAKRWNDEECDETLLNLRGPRLELALAMSKNPYYQLTPSEQAYLDGCVALREREKVAVVRQRRYATIGISVALFVIIAILAGWGLTSTNNVNEKATQVSVAHTLQSDSEYANATANIALTQAVWSAATAQVALGNEQAARIDAQTKQAEAEKNLAIAETQKAIAINKEKEAKRQAYLKLSARMSSDAIKSMNTDYNLSLLLGVEAIRVLQRNNIEWNNAANYLPIMLQKIPIGLVQSVDILSSGKVRGVVFSKGGNLMASISDSADLWDTQFPKSPKHLITLESNQPRDVLFTLNDELMIVGYRDGSVKLWEIKNPSEPLLLREINVYQVDTGIIEMKIAASANGKILAVSGQGKITLFDISNTSSPVQIGKAVTYSQRGSELIYLSFLPRPGEENSRLVAAGEDFRVWNISKSNDITLYRMVDEIDYKITSVALGQEYVVIGDTTNNLHVYDSRYKEINLIDYSQVHSKLVISTVLTKDKKLFCASQDGSVSEWDLSKPYSRIELLNHIIGGHTNRVNIVGFHPSEEILVSGGDDSRLVFWDITDVAQPSIWRSRISLINSTITTVDFNLKNSCLAVGKTIGEFNGEISGEVNIWDVSNPTSPLRSPNTIKAKSPIARVAFSPDEKHLYVWANFVSGITGQPEVFKWQSIDKKIVWDNRIWQFNPDNLKDYYSIFGNDYILMGIEGNNITTLMKLWNARENISPMKRAKLFEMKTCPALDTAITSNQLAAVAACAIQIWDFSQMGNLSSGKSPAPMVELAQEKNAQSVAWSLDGTILASGNDEGEIVIWSVSNDNQFGDPVVTIKAYQRSVIGVVFSPDGNILASASEDKTITLWDISYLENPTRLFELSESHINEIFNGGVFFTSDGKSLISASRNEIILWDLDPESWIQKACLIAGRNLTLNEWQTYYGTEESYKTTCPQWLLEPEPTATPTP
jgi:WD40 repeat protein